MHKITYLSIGLVLLLNCNVFAADLSTNRKTSFDYQQRIKWYNTLKWDEGCERDYRDTQPDKSQGGLSFWPLAVNQYLIEINCINGPYQGAFIYLYYDTHTQQSKPLQFKTYEQSSDGKIQSRMTSDVSQAYAEGPTESDHFNMQTNELTVITKYRGLNDCGHRAVYAIGEGVAKLKRFEAKFECDGKPIRYKTFFPIRKD